MTIRKNCKLSDTRIRRFFIGISGERNVFFNIECSIGEKNMKIFLLYDAKGGLCLNLSNFSTLLAGLSEFKIFPQTCFIETH